MDKKNKKLLICLVVLLSVSMLAGLVKIPEFPVVRGQSTLSVVPSGVLDYVPITFTNNQQSSQSYTASEAGFSGNGVSLGTTTLTTQDQKPAVLNGNNYIVVLNSSSYVYQSGDAGGAVEVWSANSAWQPVSMLATTSWTALGYCDLYVYTYPSLSLNTIYICGQIANSTQEGFVGTFSTSSNTLTLQAVSGCLYVTQMYYISSLNEFVITAVDGSPSTDDGYIITATPANLFIQSNWNWFSISSYSKNINLGAAEHMFTYCNGYGYISVWTAGYGANVFRVTMSPTPTSLTYIWGNGAYSTGFICLGRTRAYISSDGTYVYWSVSTNGSGYFDYYKYNPSTTALTRFASLPMVNPTGYGEHHADIIPLGNGEVLILDENDVSYGDYGTSSSWYLYKGSSQVQQFTGASAGYVQVHYSDCFLVKDSAGNIILGGECDENGPTAQAILTLLTLTSSTSATVSSGTHLSVTASMILAWVPALVVSIMLSKASFASIASWIVRIK